MKDTRCVLVTGASTGLGREFARLFAKDGYNLVITSRNPVRLRTIEDELKREYSVLIFAIQKDLSLDGAAQELYKEIKELGLTVDILVNNAGAGLCGEFISSDSRRHDEIINLNIKSLTTLSRFAAGDMARRGGGKILNVSSVGAYMPGPFIAVYYATKAYVLSLSLAVRRELKPYGVDVCAFCPGPVATEFARSAGRDTMRGAMPAVSAAVYGYRKFLRGKSVIVPGCLNRAAVVMLRFIPQRTIAFISGGVQKRLFAMHGAAPKSRDE